MKWQFTIVKLFVALVFVLSLLFPTSRSGEVDWIAYGVNFPLICTLIFIYSSKIVVGQGTLTIHRYLRRKQIRGADITGVALEPSRAGYRLILQTKDAQKAVVSLYLYQHESKLWLEIRDMIPPSVLRGRWPKHLIWLQGNNDF